MILPSSTHEQTFKNEDEGMQIYCVDSITQKGTINISTLQKRKLRLREVSKLPVTAVKKWSQARTLALKACTLNCLTFSEYKTLSRSYVKKVWRAC